MADTVGFGIVGCGMISRFHIQALAAVPEARLVGVFDIAPAARRQTAAAASVCAFDTLEDLLSCPQINVVCVCTPNGLHARIAMAALEAGRHVVIEKPMALTLEDADAIIDCARQRGLLVCVISQLRFSPAVQAVRSALRQGAFGRLMSASLSMKYFRSEDYYRSSGWRGTWAMDGGGALMNQGIHGVDLLQYLAGPVRGLYARCGTLLHDIEVEDSAAAVLDFSSGALGTLEGSTACCPGYPRRLELCGDKGSVVLQEEDILRWDLPIPMPQTSAHGSGAASDPSAISTAGHERQLQNMVNAVLRGEPLLVDGSEGRKPLEIILAIYRSSREGKSVLL